MDNPLIIIGAIVLLFYLGIKYFSKPKADKIEDDEVNVDLIKGLLANYKFKRTSKKKNSYKEEDVQADLFKYLKSKIENVSQQYILEGITKNAIDFDLGSGKIGLELKTARSIIKEEQRQRAIGQMIFYMQRKYKEGNYILAIVGEPEFVNSSSYKDISKTVVMQKGNILFIESEEMAVIENEPLKENI